MVKFSVYLNRLIFVMLSLPIIVSTDCSKAVPLLQYFFVCMLVVATVSLCLVIVCSESLLLLMPKDGRASQSL